MRFVAGAQLNPAQPSAVFFRQLNEIPGELLRIGQFPAVDIKHDDPLLADQRQSILASRRVLRA